MNSLQNNKIIKGKPASLIYTQIITPPKNPTNTRTACSILATVAVSSEPGHLCAEVPGKCPEGCKRHPAETLPWLLENEITFPHGNSP